MDAARREARTWHRLLVGWRAVRSATILWSRRLAVLIAGAVLNAKLPDVVQSQPECRSLSKRRLRQQPGEEGAVLRHAALPVVLQELPSNGLLSAAWLPVLPPLYLSLSTPALWGCSPPPRLDRQRALAMRRQLGQLCKQLVAEGPSTSGRGELAAAWAGALGRSQPRWLSTGAAEAAAAAASATHRTPPTGLRRLKLVYQNYKQLSKMRLSLLVVATSAAGYAAGSSESIDWAGLGWTSLGTMLASSSANALNQVRAKLSSTRSRRWAVPGAAAWGSPVLASPACLLVSSRHVVCSPVSDLLPFCRCMRR